MAQQDNDRRPTKAERKEQARIEREEIERKRAARNKNRVIVVIVAAVIVIVVIAAIARMSGSGSTSASPTGSSSAVPSATAPGGLPLPDPATLPGILQTPPAWPNNIAQANERLTMLGLPELSDTILHLHVRLWIYVDGDPVIVPAEVGYSQQAQVFSPLHTHDETGTVHVESADPNFKGILAQFMDVWGVYFTQTCLGDACNDGDRQLRVFVNGTQWDGDPTQIPLEDQSAIVITMGTKDQLPSPMPDSFTFTGG